VKTFFVHLGGDMKQYEQTQAPKKWLKTEEGSRKLRKTRVLLDRWES